jgi:phosphoribosylamine---glycine ligase
MNGKKLKVLVTGGGGREHALAWKLASSPQVAEVFCAPGNGGTQLPLRRVPLGALDIEALRDFAIAESVDLVVIGPDDALALGCADVMRQAGIACFGPGQDAARLESSKAFAKDFMRRHGIPCAKSETFEDFGAAAAYCDAAEYPLVVKADGLALGKGVLIVENREQARSALQQIMVDRAFGEAGSKVVVEEFLSGTECSLHVVISDGKFLLFPDAKDHKRVGENDTGPNTGGMGTISPTGLVTPELHRQIVEQIIQPFLRGLEADGLEFRGMLFPGLMLTSGGPKVLEFNCRFGDPETQVFMRRLESDLAEMLLCAAQGRLADHHPVWSDDAAACVVVASGGYPGAYEKGLVIEGLETAGGMADVVVFHAGTVRDGDVVRTSGGRVLNVTATGPTLEEARRKAYSAAREVGFPGAFFRRDIGGEPVQ